jgi:UDP-3-O-[3-hydroxymyristoyl] N-acetylglucosamine deacetylase
LRVSPGHVGAGWRFDGIPRERWTTEATDLSTVVGLGGRSVETVEHLFAALTLADLDDLDLSLEGDEVPILDGSAAAFLEAVEARIVVVPGRPTPALRLDQPVVVEAADGRIVADARPGLRPLLLVEARWPGCAGGRLELDLSSAETRGRLARARTFGFVSTVEGLRARGRALGADATCCIGLDDSGWPVPETPLRFDREPLWHKALDLLGDLARLPFRLELRVEAVGAGHALHARLVDRLRSLGV